MRMEGPGVAAFGGRALVAIAIEPRHSPRLDPAGFDR